MVLQLLRKLILVGRFWRNNFSMFSVLHHGTVPVISSHGSEKYAILRRTLMELTLTFCRRRTRDVREQVEKSCGTSHLS